MIWRLFRPSSERGFGLIERRAYAAACLRDHIAIEQTHAQTASKLLRGGGEIACRIGLGVLERIELIEAADRVRVDAAQPSFALQTLFPFHDDIDRLPVDLRKWNRNLDLGVKVDFAHHCAPIIRRRAVSMS